MPKRFLTHLAICVVLSASLANAQLDTAKKNFEAKVEEINGQLANITSTNLVVRELDSLSANDTCNRDRMQFIWEPRTSPPVPASFERPLRALIRCRTYLRREAQALTNVHSGLMASYAHTQIEFDHALATDIGHTIFQLVEPLADSAFILQWNAKSAGIDCSNTIKVADISASNNGSIKSLTDALKAHDIYESRTVLYDILTKYARSEARSDICGTSELDDVAKAWGGAAETATTAALSFPVEEMRTAACADLALKNIDYPVRACAARELTPEVEYAIHQALKRGSAEVHHPPTLPVEP